MGYGFYVLADGREAGYSVEAECDHDGCTERIDRGLAYLCGDDPGDGGEHGCGRYFCYGHLLMGGPHQMCGQCFDAFESRENRATRYRGAQRPRPLYGQRRDVWLPMWPSEALTLRRNLHCTRARRRT